MVPLAIGSQTNGSVIRPAAFCGVYGGKPTHGTISRHGALQLSQALDHVGVFARTLADTALILEVLAGYDPNDRRYAAGGGAGLSRNACRGSAAAAALCLRAHAGLGQGRGGDPRGIRRSGRAARRSGAAVDLPEAFAAAWDDQRAIMAADMAHNLDAVVARGVRLRRASSCAIFWPKAAR